MSKRDDKGYGIPNHPEKRNFASGGYEHEENGVITRYRKKKKNDVHLSGNVEDIVEPQQSTESSAKSVNGRTKVFQEKCLICMETQKSSDFKVMLCGHGFHTGCKRTWFQDDEICPACMSDNMVDNNTSFRSELEDLYRYSNTSRCVICMDAEESEDFELLSCDHRFHKMCLQTWFQIKRVCPVCMPDVSETNISIIYEDKEYIHEFSDEVRCLICLDTEKSSNFETISCSHCFHVLCIQTWFGIKQMCPTCMVNDPSSLFQDTAVYEFSEEIACNICMDTKVFSEFQYLTCDHRFHSACIKSWIEENKSCPICMEEISVSNFSNSLEKEKKIGDRCAICMDTEEYSVFEFLPCCHSFHTECIQSWIKKKKTCPICKTNITVNGKMHTLEARNAFASNNEYQVEYDNENEDANVYNIEDSDENEAEDSVEYENEDEDTDINDTVILDESDFTDEN